MRQAFDEDRLGILIERIVDLADVISSLDQIEFWLAVSRFCEKPDCEWMKSYSPMQEFPKIFTEAFYNLLGRALSNAAATSIFMRIRETGDILFLSRLLREHFIAYGLFGWALREQKTFLPKQDVELLATKISNELRERHLQNLLVPCIWSLVPVFNIMNVGSWDEECRDRLRQALSDPEAVDGLALLTSGGGFATEKAAFDQIIGYEELRSAAEQRLASSEIEKAHETVRVALGKIVSPMFCADWTPCRGQCQSSYVW